MEIEWVDGFDISVRVEDDGAVVLAANKEGLLSLARIMTTLAEDESRGAHIHLDQYNSLDDGSAEFIIERVP